MDRMKNYRSHEVVTGSFILAAIVVFALFAFRAGGMDLFAWVRSKTLRCRCYVTDVRTLEVGAKVAVAGRRVGRVHAIGVVDRELDEREAARLRRADPTGRFAGLRAGMKRTMVAVDFELDEPDLRLDPRTASVRIAQEGLLGRFFLALDPGYWAETQRPPTILNARLDEPVVLPAESSVSLESLMAAARPLVGRVDRLLAKLDEGLLGEANLRRIEETLDGLARLQARLRRLLDPEASDGIPARVLDPLARTLEQGPAAATSARHLFERATAAVEDARPRVSAVLERLERVSGELTRTLEEVRGDLRRLFEAATGVLEDNRTELAETVRRLRRTMWQAELAMRKVRANPAVLFFGDEETDLEAAPFDHARAARRGRARPYGQRDENDDGR